MTQLIGSEKQVSWAEGIRSQWIEEAEKVITAQKDEMSKSVLNDFKVKLATTRIEKMTQFIASMKDIKSAQWIIDHRDAGKEFGHYSSSVGVWGMIFGTIRESYKNIF